MIIINRLFNKYNASQIYKGLWMGDQIAAEDNKFFKKYNIKSVVNCTPDIKFNKLAKNKLHLSVNDNLQIDQIMFMYKYLEKITEWIHNSLENNKNVLVHCHMGRQRSGCVIAAYLMKYKNMKYPEVIKYIKKFRQEAFFGGVNFEIALKLFQRDINKNKFI
jgi:protein-tyrosine phosphatase